MKTLLVCLLLIAAGCCSHHGATKTDSDNKDGTRTAAPAPKPAGY